MEGTCEPISQKRPSKCTKYWSLENVKPPSGTNQTGLSSTEQPLNEDETEYRYSNIYEDDAEDDLDSTDEDEEDEYMYDNDEADTDDTDDNNDTLQKTTVDTDTKRVSHNIESTLINSSSVVPGAVDDSVGLDGENQVGLDGVSYDETTVVTNEKETENLFVYRPVSTWPTYTPRQPVCTPKIKRNARPVYTSGSSDTHFSYGTLLYGSNTQSLHNISSSNMYSSYLNNTSS
jgi:hypothetical protein